MVLINILFTVMAVMTNAQPICVFLGFSSPDLGAGLKPLRIFLMTTNEKPALCWFPGPNFGAGGFATHSLSCKD